MFFQAAADSVEAAEDEVAEQLEEVQQVATEVVDLDEDEEADDEVEVVQPDDTKEEPSSTVDDLAEELGTMVIGKTSSGPFSMGFSFPYIMYKYVDENRRKITIDFLVFGVQKAFFKPKVVQDGRAIQVGVRIPDFFPDDWRLQVANTNSRSFNTNTNKATALREVVAKICDEQDDNQDGFIGPPQVIKLTDKVDEEILYWEIHAFENDCAKMATKFAGNQQYFFILTIDLLVVERVKKVNRRGAMKVFASPIRRPRSGDSSSEEEEVEDGDDVMPDHEGSL